MFNYGKSEEDIKLNPFKDYEFRSAIIDRADTIDMRQFITNYNIVINEEDDEGIPTTGTVLTGTCPLIIVNRDNRNDTCELRFREAKNYGTSYVALKAKKQIYNSVTWHLPQEITLQGETAGPHLHMVNRSNTAYDPIIDWAVGNPPVTKFIMGVDDSDSDKWKIATGSVLGIAGNDALVIDSTGIPYVTNIRIGNLSPGFIPFHVDDTTGFQDSEIYTPDGLFYGLNVYTNAFMTIGITLNQGANDDEILAFKANEVAHGMTTIAETDTYGNILKLSATAGGVNFRGFSEGAEAAAMAAYYTNDDTTKSSAGTAPIELRVNKKSGTGRTAPGADANLIAIMKWDGVSAFSSVWIADEDGDTWQSGSFTGTQGIFNIADGTTPLVITSTTKVSNLNVDKWDGYDLPTLEDGKYLKNSGGALVWDTPTVGGSTLIKSTPEATDYRIVGLRLASDLKIIVTYVDTPGGAEDYVRSTPLSGQYRISGLRLDSSLKIVVTYSDTPEP